MEENKMVDDGSFNEDTNWYAKQNCRVPFEGGFSKYITNEIVKKLATAVLSRHPLTQEQLATFCFDDEDIEKYGLEHLVAGGYKRRPR